MRLETLSSQCTVASQTFASHGNNLYSGSRDRTIKHWRLPDGALLGSVNLAHDDWVCSLAVDESSSLLVSGTTPPPTQLFVLCVC